MSVDPEANESLSAEAFQNPNASTSIRSLTGKDSSTLTCPATPSPTTPEPWLSPLDRIARQQAIDNAISPRFSADTKEIPSKMNEESLDLSSVGEPPVGHRDGHDEWSPRMPFHSNECFQMSPQPVHSALSDDDLSKGGVEQTDSRVELLTEDEPSVKKATPTRAVSFAPSSTTFSYPSPGKHISPSWPSEPASWSFSFCGGVWQWHPSFSMYLCFVFGILCSVGHHIYYLALDGQPAINQTEMLRYGTFLAYAAKAGFSATVISAYKQRVWVTVRNRFVTISALDAMFAAAEDMVTMLNLDFLRHAKGAYALALFAWTTPLVVILTANTLLVEPRQMSHDTTCPAVRTLNFTFEETNEWRNPTQIDGLFENPVSLWNTTKRADDSDPNWFDYYTGPSPNFQQTASLGAFLEEVVARKHASADTCGVGWNCTFTINFTAPGYQCMELASGVDSVPQNLTQESGEAVPPFGTDLLLPRGNFSYYAFTSGGEYSGTQLENVSIGGIPLMSPPYPDHFGALRTEPVIWVGYTILNYPNQSQPTRNEPGWDEAFTPKIFACEHRETAYVANFTYIDVSSHVFFATRTHTQTYTAIPSSLSTLYNHSGPRKNQVF